MCPVIEMRRVLYRTQLHVSWGRGGEGEGGGEGEPGAGKGRGKFPSEVNQFLHQNVSPLASSL